MNIRQRRIVFVGLMIEALMITFPPYRWQGGIKYHPFFNPPISFPFGYPIAAKINITVLIFQCLIVAIIFIGIAVLLGSKKE